MRPLRCGKMRCDNRISPMSNPLESWTEEQRSAYLYSVCSEAEAGTPRAELFRRLAGEAQAQAAIWRAMMTASGKPAPAPFEPEPRTRLVARMVRTFGPRRMRSVLAAMKVRGMAIYSEREPGGHLVPVAGTVERGHRGLGGVGNLRAAVFGVNDGLVSNASLIFGIAGANAAPSAVLLAGVAGLAAGAFAMAAGEYVSVRSQRELFEYQIGLERDELAEYPEAEAQELALIYGAKGMPAAEARRLAKKLVADPERALDTLAREELGLNPSELGSPWGAAISSFLSFTLGAAIPLLPFLLGAGTKALPLAAAMTGVALFTIGATLSLFTGRGALRSGARMLLLGGLAAAVTFGVGHVAGIAVG
jgi:vacuolar iron transporter family protein